MQGASDQTSPKSHSAAHAGGGGIDQFSTSFNDFPRLVAARFQTSCWHPGASISEDDFYGDVTFTQFLLDYLQLMRVGFKPETGSEIPIDPG